VLFAAKKVDLRIAMSRTALLAMAMSPVAMSLVAISFGGSIVYAQQQRGDPPWATFEDDVEKAAAPRVPGDIGHGDIGHGGTGHGDASNLGYVGSVTTAPQQPSTSNSNWNPLPPPATQPQETGPECCLPAK
jgi:hypothetical protein